MQPSDWERIFSTLGVPISILIALGLGLRNLIRWFKPHAETIFAAHVRLLDTCSHTLTKLDSNTIINSERIDQLTKHTLDPNGPCQRTVSAMIPLSKAVESLGDKCPEVAHHTENMRQILGGL